VTKKSGAKASYRKAIATFKLVPQTATIVTDNRPFTISSTWLPSA
jgi:hypothetical protein